MTTFAVPQPILHCPDCGRTPLHVIEQTEPDDSGEYKLICTCYDCPETNIVTIHRWRKLT